jgi:hypothetical protein
MRKATQEAAVNTLRRSESLLVIALSCFFIALISFSVTASGLLGIELASLIKPSNLRSFVLLTFSLGLMALIGSRFFTVAKGWEKLFELPLTLNLLMIVALALPALIFWGNPLWQAYLPYGPLEEYMLLGLIAANIGIAGMWVAYALVSRLLSPEARYVCFETEKLDWQLDWPRSVTNTRIWFFASVFFLVLYNFVFTAGGFFSINPTISHFFRTIAQFFYLLYSVERFAIAVLVFAFAAAVRRGDKTVQRVYRRWLLLMVAVIATYALIGGMKVYFVLPAVSLVTALFYSRTRMPLGVVVLALVVFIGMFWFVPEYRSELSSRGRTPDAIPESVASTFGTPSGEDISEVVTETFSTAMRRFASHLYYSGLLVDQTGSKVPWQGMEDLLLLPLYFVPRFLWHGKPVMNRGGEIMADYFGKVNVRGQGFTVPLWGDLYSMGGWEMVIVGGCLIGVTYAVLFNLLIARGNSYRKLVYIALIPIFVMYEGSFVGLVKLSIQSTIAMLILVRFILVSKSSTHSSDASKTKDLPACAF